MVISFPNSPSTNDIHSQGALSWRWNGSSWLSVNAGVQGAQGLQGIQGVQGITGAQGTFGTQGAAGFVGSNGAQGAQGIQGIDGSQGINGSNGAQGTQGIQGLKGTKITPGDTAPASPSENDLWWDSTNGILMVYYNDGTSSQWVSANSGIAGEQGIQGIQGVQGIQGTQGIQGIQGVQGTQGTQGVQGIQGITGLAFTIAKTYLSVAALTADTSPTSIVAGQFALINTTNVEDAENSRLYIWTGSAYTFVDDLSGSAGIQGITGSQGVQGIQGTLGTQGITGSQGTQGTQGIQGIQGISGASILGTNNTFTGTNAFTTLSSTGGATFATSSGSVGIGTASPGATLDVNGNSRFMQNAAATTGAIILRQAVADAEGAFIQWVNNANVVEKGWLTVDTSSNMKFGTVSTERMRIDSSGNVSIGTTSPAVRFHVQSGSAGATALRLTDAIRGTLNVDFPATSQIRFDVGAAEKMLFSSGTNTILTINDINSSGGIAVAGTTTTTGNFTSSSSQGTIGFSAPGWSGSGAAYTIANVNATLSGAGDYIGHYVPSGKGWTWVYGSNSQAMTITSTGNVGIGTASPVTLLSSATLQVYGNAKLGNANDRGLLSLGDVTSTGANVAIWRGAAGAYGAAGNVLCLGGYDGITFTTGNTSVDSQTERMRITSTGNVGIGTTAPLNKLDVFGDGIRLSNSGTYDAILRLDFDGVSSDSFKFQTVAHNTAATGLVTQMVIKQNGSVGIGTTSPEYKFEVKGGVSWFRNFDGTAASPTETHDWPVAAMNIASYGNYNLQTMLAFTLPNDGNYFLGYGAWNFKLDQTVLSTTSAGVSGMQFGGPGYLAFLPGGTEKVRIYGDGNMLVGTTTVVQSSQLTVNGSLATDGLTSHAGTGGAYQSNKFNFQWTGSAALWVDGTNIGNIATSSDYRIKKNVTTQTASGLDRVMQLRPVSYEYTDYKELFKADGIIREGFIAHEVQEVIPSGAQGAKDEENQIQSLRIDAILSVTVKALQELKADNDALRARIAALESK
jgi:hypothetical protein